jgi:hypothetical protein
VLGPLLIRSASRGGVRLESQISISALLAVKRLSITRRPEQSLVRIRGMNISRGESTVVGWDRSRTGVGRVSEPRCSVHGIGDRSRLLRHFVVSGFEWSEAEWKSRNMPCGCRDFRFAQIPTQRHYMLRDTFFVPKRSDKPTLSEDTVCLRRF